MLVLAPTVGLYAADHIVCARPDGYEVFADVYVEALAQFADDGKSFGEVLLVEVADVEVNVGGFGFEHLFEDGPADDVARGKFGGWVVIFHKCPAFGVQQDGPFAAERLGNQCAGAPAI